MFDNMFKRKAVLVTGHTGFKGSWLCIWLNELGANVIGYALEPYTERDNFVVSGIEDRITHTIGDVRDFQGLSKAFEEHQPEFVFHLAAQAIVRESYINPKETYDINVGGTVNVLECCRISDSVKVVVNVTSDKCYENKEWARGYREGDPMGGYDPYSSSKGCSELITAAYRKSFFNSGKGLSSVRAGNVIGGGDWQKDRLIPDCIKALENNKLIKIRSPDSIRPWQHVLEPLSGYLLLALKMHEEPGKFSGAWNFGPENNSIITVGEIVDLVIEKWENGKWSDISDKSELHEAKLLSLDISKATNLLNWRPKWNIQKCVDKTVEWYKNIGENDLYNVCKKQIDEYIKMED